jgi:hypothetical protein
MDNGGHHLTRWQTGLLTKEHHRNLQGGKCVNKQSTFWQHPSYLRESLPLDILHALFQGDHLTMLLPMVLKEFDLLSLLFGLPNKIVDHVGQLLNLNLLHINATVQLVYHPPYTVRRITVRATLQSLWSGTDNG